MKIDVLKGLACKLSTRVNYFCISKALYSRKTVSVKLRPDVDLEVILPHATQNLYVNWTLSDSKINNVVEGDILCSLLNSQFETRSSVLSPVSGILRVKYYSRNNLEPVSKNRVLCLIQVHQEYVDINPYIVTHILDIPFRDGTIEWVKGVGMLVDKGSHICTVTCKVQSTGEVKTTEIFAPIDGIVKEIFAKDTISQYSRLCVIKPFQFRKWEDAHKKKDVPLFLALSQYSRITSREEVPALASFLPKPCTGLFIADLSRCLKYAAHQMDKRNKKTEVVSPKVALLAVMVKCLVYGLKYHKILNGQVVGLDVVDFKTIDVSVGLMDGMNMVFPTIRDTESLSCKEIMERLILYNKLVKNHSVAQLEFDPQSHAVTVLPWSSECAIIPGMQRSPGVSLSMGGVFQDICFTNEEFRVRPSAYITITVDKRLGSNSYDFTVFYEKIKWAIKNPGLTLL